MLILSYFNKIHYKDDSTCAVIFAQINGVNFDYLRE